MSSYVFIDGRVPDYEMLLAALAPDLEVILLDATQDGIAQVASALEGVTGLDAIHILSHGSEGTLFLGGSVINSENLVNYATELATIGAALTGTGDILLYGCDVAGGMNGQSFIDDLARYTGADVAASTDTTGAATLGGDWVLEASAGTIETQAIASSTFEGLLATTPIELTTIAAGTGGFVIYGQDAGDRSGDSVASAGDINGDGFDDLIIGARTGGAAGNAKGNAGESYVVFGKADGFGAVIDLTTIAAGSGGFVIYGQDVSDLSGHSVASAGDINGDGFDDLFIGAYRGDAAGNAKSNAGESYVVFGKADGFGAVIDLTTIAAGSGGFVIYGQDAGDYSGSPVASAGDINGDGFDDLIIGAASGDAAGNAKSGAGDSYVVFGKASGFGASIDLTTIAAGSGGFVIYGQDAGDGSGHSVASAGDINGDGFDDLIIGAFAGDAAGNAKSSAGDSYVVFGKAGSWAASIDLTTIAAGTGGFVIYGQDAGDYFGLSVASAGDINGDGFDDLFIGAYRGDAAGNAKDYAGDSYVVFGKASGFGASIDLTTIAAGTGGFVIYGQDAGDLSGFSLSSAGDINGDGFDDLIMGAPGGGAAGNAKSGAGDSYVVFGKAGGWAASIDLATIAAGTGGFVIYGRDVFDQSGSSVASAGDINGDGFDDLIIGARSGDAAGNAKDYAGDSYVIFGQAFDVTVTHQGSSGADNLTGTASADIMIGGLGNDTINGGADADALRGGGGDDTLAGGAGADRINGGNGHDTADYTSSGAAVTINLTVSLQSGGDAAGDILSDIENVIGSGLGDTLTGDGHASVLSGMAGNDTLDGGPGADQLYGGTGNDTYYVDGQADIVFENAGEGTDTVISTTSFYLYDNIENLTLAAGTGNTFGSANASNNTLIGNEGNNLLLGWDGGDTLSGGAGNDVIYGVNGDDSLQGDAGIDVLIAGEGNDTLDGGADPDEMYGENGNDQLYGGTGFVTDILVAGAGNDTLDGSASIVSGQPRNQGDFDLLYGGTGDDTYYVDTPSDLTFEFNGNTEGIDSVIADINGAGFYLYDSVENLTLVGNTVYGVGNGQDNVITGNAIGTFLLGGGGNDTINGKAGNDVLFGETGADTFVFERGTGGDVVGDFQVGIDKIKLVSIGYNSFAQVQPHLVENAGTTAIDLGLGDLVVLNGVAIASLSAGDFLFV